MNISTSSIQIFTCISESFLHSVSVLVLQTAEGIFLLCDLIQREAYSPVFSKQTDTAFLDISNFLRGRKSLPMTLSLKVHNYAIVKVFIDELGVLNCKTIQFSCSCGCLLQNQFEKISTVGSNFSSYCNSTRQGIFPSILQSYTLSSATPGSS